MFSCFKATQLISLSHERPLAFKDKASLRMHLMICSMCRNFRNNTKLLGVAMVAYTRHDG
jgi:hypothetical protein